MELKPTGKSKAAHQAEKESDHIYREREREPTEKYIHMYMHLCMLFVDGLKLELHETKAEQKREKDHTRYDRQLEYLR